MLPQKELDLMMPKVPDYGATTDNWMDADGPDVGVEFGKSPESHWAVPDFTEVPNGRERTIFFLVLSQSHDSGAALHRMYIVANCTTWDLTLRLLLLRSPRHLATICWARRQLPFLGRSC